MDGIQGELGDTVWQSGCNSWYMDATGRNSTIWPRVHLLVLAPYPTTGPGRLRACASTQGIARRLLK